MEKFVTYNLRIISADRNQISSVARKTPNIVVQLAVRVRAQVLTTLCIMEHSWPGHSPSVSKYLLRTIAQSAILQVCLCAKHNSYSMQQICRYKAKLQITVQQQQQTLIKYSSFLSLVFEVLITYKPITIHSHTI